MNSSLVNTGLPFNTALRKVIKISQADLAKEAGVSREIIGRYERNEVSPSVDVAKKTADALEVSLDYLAGGSDKAAFDKQTLKLIDESRNSNPLLKINVLSWLMPLSGMLKLAKPMPINI